MNKLEIKDYESEWSINLGKVKIIINRNQEHIYRLIRTLEHHFNKDNVSEYEESQKDISLKFNEKQINFKEFQLIEVNQNSNVDDELKVGVKSIVYRYLELKLENIEFTDEFNLLNQGFSIMTDEILKEFEVSELDTSINFKLPQLNKKTIIKLIDAYLIKEDCYALDFDLSLNEKIRLLIRLINQVTTLDKEKRYLVILRVNNLNEDIYKAINEVNSDFVNMIIIADQIECSVSVQDVFYVGSNKIDFSDDEDIFQNLVIDMGLFLDVDDAMSSLEIILKNRIETKKLFDLLN